MISERSHSHSLPHIYMRAHTQGAFKKYVTFSLPKLILYGQNPLSGRWCHSSCAYVKIFVLVGQVSSWLLCPKYNLVVYTCWIFIFMQDDQNGIKISWSRTTHNLFNKLSSSLTWHPVTFGYSLIWEPHNLLLLFHQHHWDKFCWHSLHALILC